MSQLPQFTLLSRIPEYKEGDYYSILGVNRMATKEQIAKRFREIGKTYHPDKLGFFDIPEVQKKTMIDYYNLANEAKEILLNDEKRAIFDKNGCYKDSKSNPSNTLASAKRVLSSLFATACNQATKEDYENKDLLEAISNTIINKKSSIMQSIEKAKQNISRHEEILSRIFARSGQTWMTESAVKNLDRLKEQLAELHGEVLVCEKALEIIEEYEYNYDSDFRWVMLQPNSTGTTQTANCY